MDERSTSVEAEQRHGERRRRVATYRLMAVAVLVVTSTLLLASCGDDSQSSGSAASCEPKERKFSADPAAAGSRPTLPEADAALGAAVSSSFCSVFTTTFPDGTKRASRPPVVTPNEAACIGQELVDRLGAARVRALGLGLGPWSTLGIALSNQIDRSEAERIVDTFKNCSKTWKLLLITSVTQGADEISDKSAQCISEQISDDTTRTIFVGEIDRAYDDPSQPNAQPYPQLVEPLVAAFDKCLTPTEQAAMDWN
ncbi:MAG TPA: hypothetical protein VM282_16550 [Acidimicrobiales bacterium]|nr:hypothetical protein [Acidimicrobiales bacterium]